MVSIVKKQYLMSSWNGNGCSVFNMPTVVQMFLHTLPCLDAFGVVFFLFTHFADSEAASNKNDKTSLFDHRRFIEPVAQRSG